MTGRLFDWSRSSASFEGLLVVRRYLFTSISHKSDYLHDFFAMVSTNESISLQLFNS